MSKKENEGVFHYATEQCDDSILSRAIYLLKRLSSSVDRLIVSGVFVSYQFYDFDIFCRIRV